jgi:predicted neutral ceramidase superfamily lipid hydrolase
MESGAYFIILISLGLALAIPLIIFGIFLHRVRVLKQSWKSILLKVLSAVIVWTCLSVLMLFFDFAFVYASAHVPPEARGVAVRPFISILIATLVYGLAGWGLCYWVGHTEDSSNHDLGLV